MPKTAEAPKKSVKAPVKAAPAKKAPVKKVEAKEASDRGPTIRQKVFDLLYKSSEGLTGGEIKEALEINTVPMLLKDEGVCENPRIKRIKVEGTRGVKYMLTPRGRKAVEKGTIDSEPAASSTGEEWPEGR